MQEFYSAPPLTAVNHVARTPLSFLTRASTVYANQPATSCTGVTHTWGETASRNTLACQSIERKLSVRASPTCVMHFDRAVGMLIGAENAGMEQMFAMMNAARFAVGVQGIAVSERAYQRALAYARERMQGRAVDGSVSGPVAIFNHPDVRRILGQMRARTEACRSLAAFAAAGKDAALADYLVPVVKGFCTEMAVLTTSDGAQVHGGMGFIEETGASQLYRDALILPIYEGTTAIQANDLLSRKTLRDGGAVALALSAQIAATEGALRTSAQAGRALQLASARADFEKATSHLLVADPLTAHAGAVPYLMLTGNLLAGWQMARAALAAEASVHDDPPFMTAKIATARFYLDHHLPETALQRRRIVEGAKSLLDLTF